MISLAGCASCAKLPAGELISGATKCRKHDALLLTYILNTDKGPVAVREMILSDLRAFLDLGASTGTAGLLLVLQMFLSKYPEACLSVEDGDALRKRESFVRGRVREMFVGPWSA